MRAKHKRTPEVVNAAIDAKVKEKDDTGKAFKAELRELTNEYDHAVGIEAARKKFEAMGEVEKQAFRELLEEGN